MKTFILIFRMPAGKLNPPTPEQLAARQQWFLELQSKDVLAGSGGTMPPEGLLIDSNRQLQSSLYKADNQWISGFLAIHAGSLKEASELAKTNPVFQAGGTVEVRELLSPPVKS